MILLVCDTVWRIVQGAKLVVAVDEQPDYIVVGGLIKVKLETHQ